MRRNVRSGARLPVVWHGRCGAWLPIAGQAPIGIWREPREWIEELWRRRCENLGPTSLPMLLGAAVVQAGVCHWLRDPFNLLDVRCPCCREHTRLLATYIDATTGDNTWICACDNAGSSLLAYECSGDPAEDARRAAALERNVALRLRLAAFLADRSAHTPRAVAALRAAVAETRLWCRS